MNGAQGLRERISLRTKAAIDRLKFKPKRSGAAEANVLAISDLHLGQDLRRGVKRAPVPHQDGPLAALLDHHATRWEEGRPWRLVIAGDMVDFIRMTVTPEPTEVVPFDVTPAERLGGLYPEPAKAVWKLAKVIERHRIFFTRLASFIAAGNELVIIRGNHDQEWSLPRVQEVLQSALVEFALPLRASGPEARAERERQRQAFVARIQFCDWFYLEPGRLYVEHGHLHDEFSSVADFDRPRGAPVLHESVSTRALRLFGNRHDGLDMNDLEQWSLWDFVRWASKSGELGGILRDYLGMTARLLSYSLRASVKTMAKSLRRLARFSRALAVDDGRVEKLRAMLRGVREDHEALAPDLLGLLQPPAEESVLACAQMLYVDRVLLGFAVAGGITSCAASSLALHWRAGGLALVVMVALGLNYLLSRGREIDSHPKLLRAAHRVAVLFGVDYVVMGHSHRAIDQEVADGTRYINLGTWLAPSRDEQGVLSFPHLVVVGQNAVLRRWYEERRESVVA